MKKTYFLATIILTALAITSPALAQTWSSPKSTPPGSNVSTPINLSNIAQTKIGGIILNNGGATYGLLVPFGKVGIGTLTPGGIFDVFGSSGIAFTVLADGKVGIGTASPASQLTVVGGVQVGNDSATCTTAKAGTMRWSNSSGTYRLEVCNGTAWVATGSSGSSGSYVLDGYNFAGYCSEDEISTNNGPLYVYRYAFPPARWVPYPQSQSLKVAGCGCQTGHTIVSTYRAIDISGNFPPANSYLISKCN